MSVLTVTLNPAIDQLVTLEQLRPGTVHRARSVRWDPGGKGINVASCLADWGVPVAVTGLLGRDNAASFESLFATKQISDRFVRTEGATRTNIKIVAGDNTTDINLPGGIATPELLGCVDARAHEADDIVALGGSLPQGCPPDYFARLLARLHAQGARVIVDTHGPALAAVLGGEIMPFCIKPNADELAQWAGRPLNSCAEILCVAAELRARGVSLVVVSRGEQGALFMSNEGAVIAQLAAPAIVSTVGAGDAMVAGVIAALIESASLERFARLATAFAVGKIGGAGPNLPSRAVVEDFATRTAIQRQDRCV